MRGNEIVQNLNKSNNKHSPRVIFNYTPPKTMHNENHHNHHIHPHHYKNVIYH